MASKNFISHIIGYGFTHKIQCSLAECPISKALPQTIKYSTVGVLLCGLIEFLLLQTDLHWIYSGKPMLESDARNSSVPIRRPELQNNWETGAAFSSVTYNKVCLS